MKTRARRSFCFSLFVLGFASIGCGGSNEPPAAAPPTSAPPTASLETPRTQPSATAPAPAASAEMPKATAPTPIMRVIGFSAPESVIYDEARDRYLVSNVNGTPFEVDNNGFISEVSPDGKVTNLKWIEGGKDKVTLNAPKGLAVSKDIVYVADLTVVRMFDAKTGKAKGEIKIPGATFLNDMTWSDDGKVYVSDSGVKSEGEAFKPTGTDAVWIIENGKAKPLAKATDMGGPNGVAASGKNLVVVTLSSGEAYRLDDKGKKGDVTKLPKGMLDGVVTVGDNVYVSSWEASAIYKGKLGGTFEPFFSDMKAPADIGFDKKRSRLLVPRMMDNALEAYDIQ